MRVPKNLSTVAIAICVLISSSCTKQITEESSSPAGVPSAATSSVCKPEVLASLGNAFIDGILVTDVWNNIMQRWFEGGKVAYLKADLGYGFNKPGIPPRIRWGVASYQNDLVLLRDQGRGGILILRAQVDNLGRPVKSEYFEVDGMETGKYTYNASGDLGTATFRNNNGFMETYTFNYGSKGELTSIESPNSLTTFLYNYDKPVDGMLGLHGVNVHLKLMEYMDLVELPVKYQLLSVTASPAPGGGTLKWDYTDIRLFAGSLVYSYKCPTLTFAGNIYYVGWTCDGPLSRANETLKKEITSREEFQRQYPNAGITR